MSEAQKFQHIIDGIREDLTLIEELCGKLDWNLFNNEGLWSTFDFYYKKAAFEIIEWINDVFLDKIYETNSKIHKFLTDMSLGGMYNKVSIQGQAMEKCLKDIMQEKDGLGRGNTHSNLDKLKIAISNYRYSIDTTMDYVRKQLYETNWASMKKINIEDYLLLAKRRRYIKARDELEWVKQAIKEGKYEDILTHLRTAIDLAIKERFGFTKIWMKPFLIDAKENGFPLPSYTMLYDYYDEGSQRLHSGRLNTPYECQKALDFVDGFIDRLELINISQEEIDNFKKKCRCVE